MNCKHNKSYDIRYHAYLSSYHWLGKWIDVFGTPNIFPLDLLHYQFVFAFDHIYDLTIYLLSIVNYFW